MVTAGILVSILAGGFDFSIENQRWQFLVLALDIGAHVPAQHAAPAPPLRAPRAAPGDDGGASTSPARQAAGDRPRHVRDVNRHRAARGELQPHAGAARHERRRSGELRDPARRRRSESASPATCTTRSTSRSTALLLRIEAAAQDAPENVKAQLAQVKEPGRPGDGRAARPGPPLRPTALDDHGLVAALRTHVRDFDRRGPARASFWAYPRRDLRSPLTPRSWATGWRRRR